MNTNTKNAAKKAEKGREQAVKAAEQTEPKTEAKTEQNTPKKAEERNVKTMKKTEQNAAKNAPKTEAAAVKTEAAPKAAEPKKTEERAVKTVEQIKALFEQAKNGATKEDRMKAAEEAKKAVEAFNAAALENAAKRCTFAAAVEAYRPNAPKKAEAAKKGVDYTRRAEPVQYIHLNEEGEAAARIMNLVTFARVAFMKTANAEQAARFSEALTALEAYEKNYIEQDKNEGAKAAAEALTALVKVCGLNLFTAKRAEDGKMYPFFIDRSFVKAAAARLKARRGVYTSEAAAVEEAALKALEASAKGRAKAEERRAKAEENAVKAVFAIIAEAAAAAVVGVWKAEVKTAEAVRAEAAERERRNAAREEDRAKKAAAREAKNAEQAKKAVEKKRAALEKAARELKAAEDREAALKAEEAKKNAAA